MVISHLITPSVVGLWGTLGTTMTSFGVLLGETTKDTSPVDAISNSTLVPVGMMLTGITVTAALVWKVASQKHTVELNIKDLENRIGRLEEEIEEQGRK